MTMFKWKENDITNSRGEPVILVFHFTRDDIEILEALDLDSTTPISISENRSVYAKNGDFLIKEGVKTHFIIWSEFKRGLSNPFEDDESELS